MAVRDPRSIHAVAASLQETVRLLTPLSSEITRPSDQAILPHSLFEGTRGYIERIAFQINACYSATCYDACAVMIRRLIELLIIEVYEHNDRASYISDPNGNYLNLEGLVDRITSDSSLRLGRTTTRALRKFKQYGDLSAHGRRYNAKRQYIDDHVLELRSASEELLYCAGWKQ